MNEDERQALAKRISSRLFDEYVHAEKIASGVFNEYVHPSFKFAIAGIVQTVLYRLDEDGCLREPQPEIPDLWMGVKLTRKDIATLADEAETWPSVMECLRNSQKILAIRSVQAVVRAAKDDAPSLVVAKDVVDEICARHGWNSSAWSTP